MRQVQGATEQAATSAGLLSRLNFGAFKDSIKGIEEATKSLGDQFPKLTQAVGRFALRLTALGAGAVAAGVKLVSSATAATKAFDGQNDSLDKATAAQQRANDVSLQGQVAAINHASSLRQLMGQYARGEITLDQYQKSLQDTNRQYDEQRAVAAQVENATERVRLENERLQKSLADRKAFNELIDTFGGPLTTSLVTFGRQAEQVRAQFIRAFGPGLANLIDIIGATLNKNSGAINNFFSTASTKINQLISTQGPALQKMFETLGSAISSVVIGLIDAAPGIIDFFNNKLAPAISKIVGFFGLFADGINAVFGTKLTAGSVFLIAVFAQMSGSLRLLFTVLRAGSAIFKGFLGIANAVAVSLDALFGGKFIGQLVKLSTTLIRTGNPLTIFFTIIRSGIPLIVSLGEALAVALGIGFGPAVAIVLALAAAVIFLFTKADWKKWGSLAADAVTGIISFLGRLVQGAKNIGALISAAFSVGWEGLKMLAADAVAFVIEQWNALGPFFSNLWNLIKGAFALGWEGLKLLASDAAQFVVNAWNNLVTFFQNLPTTIGTFFTQLWQSAQDLAGAAVQFITDKWNALVAFFQALPDTLANIWTAIKDGITNAFNSAIQFVKGLFQEFVSTVKGWLQPLIDMINKIASAISGGSDATQPGFKGGGKITGPGGPTQDKIPIWASNGEFMMRAKAVAKYGTAFMHAVNSGRFRMPKFAFGGPIITPAPARSNRFADGGSIQKSSLQPLSLTIDGQTFDGLMMPENVGKRMTRFAISKSVRSGGRKPSWVTAGR
jgi:hypothetical protein